MKFACIMAISLLVLVTTNGQERCAADLPCGGTPRFAEYGSLSSGDERALLDHLASQFRKASDHMIYVLVYAGQASCLDEAKARAVRIKKYLVKKQAIQAARIIRKDGGFQPHLSVQIWLLPRGSKLPKPVPTLELVQVHSRKNCEAKALRKW